METAQCSLGIWAAPLPPFLLTLSCPGWLPQFSNYSTPNVRGNACRSLKPSHLWRSSEAHNEPLEGSSNMLVVTHFKAEEPEFRDLRWFTPGHTALRRRILNKVVVLKSYWIVSNKWFHTYSFIRIIHPFLWLREWKLGWWEKRYDVGTRSPDRWSSQRGDTLG